MPIDFSKIVEPIQKALEKYKNLPNIELEGRLGIWDEDNQTFDSNIGEEYYNTINQLLESCQKWEDKKNSNLDAICACDGFIKTDTNHLPLDNVEVIRVK
jgi:hypothetical protein